MSRSPLSAFFRPLAPRGNRRPAGQLLRIGLALCFLCRVGMAAPDPVTLGFEIDGMEREAVVFPGEGHGPSNGFPLVLVFHGHGGNAGRQARKLAIHKHWPEAIVVYPQGEAGIRGRTDWRGVRTGWQKSPGQADDRDVKLVDALMEDLSKRYPIDSRRVYAVGHSNGGRFVAVLWAVRPEKFAAFASACGQGGRLIRDAEPKPVMMIMGERDRLVPIRGQRESIAYARELLEVDESHAKTEGYVTYEPGIEGTELVTYIHPGGHAWPDKATPYIVDFFKRHALASPGHED